jgi:very-short-patch-repair endonuclease
MNWDEWIAENRKQIEHVAGYEENFVRTILAKIPEIRPEDVTAQYHFKDSNGGNRYIDFMILNQSKGYQLPIELDGYWKVNNYRDFNDMLERQNDLMAIYGVLLRYTNNKMNQEPDKIVIEIRKTLELQSKNQLSQKTVEKQNQQRVNQYQQELNQLKNELTKQKSTNNRSSSTITGSEIASIQVAIAELQANINHNSASKVQHIPIEPVMVSKPKEPTKTKVTANQMLIAGSAGLVIVALGANAFFNKSNDNAPIALVGESSSLVYDTDDGQSSINGSNAIAESAQASIKSSSINTSGAVVADQDSNTNTPSFEDTPAEPVFQDIPPPTAIIKREAEKVDVYQPPSNQAQNSQSYEAAISNTVPAAQAYKYIGDYRVVCGHVAQVKGFSKGKYLNLGTSYPNQDVTVVVWNSDMGNFDNVDQYEGKDICVQGTVSSYKGTPQIKLSSMNQLK